MLRLPMMVFALITLLYVFVTPPFQVNDEANHFFKAYQLSEGIVFNTARDGALGNYLPSYVADLAQRQFPAETPGLLPAYRWSDLVHAWRQPVITGERQFTEFSNIANYSPTLYAPQALGILVARSLGAPPLGQFYAGRLVNALVGISLVLMAISLVPVGRPAMMAFATLPMVSNQLGSFSADATIIGLSFLTIACSLHQVRKLFPPRWIALWPAVLSLLALAKGVYLPLALSGLSIRPRRLWYPIWLAASLAAAALVASIWLKLNSRNFIRQAFIGRKSHQHMLAAVPAEQLAYIVGHPLAFAHALVSDFLERLPVYVVGGIGRFGWFTVMLPLPVYALALAVICLALVAPTASNPWPSVWRRLFWGALFAGGVVLIETALYLTATSLGADYVEGVQGRYYIPYLPLLGLALAFPLRADTIAGRFVLLALSPAMIALMISGLIVSATSFWKV